MAAEASLVKGCLGGVNSVKPVRGVSDCKKATINDAGLLGAGYG